jgi:hypothetical protein
LDQLSFRLTYKIFSRIKAIWALQLFSIFFSALLFSLAASANESRGIALSLPSGDVIDLYEDSYALVVGVGDYSEGWPKLRTVRSEVQETASLLREIGFVVEIVLNPDAESLEDAFEDFVDSYGYNESNRLLFYFAGHGYTRANNTKGYLVPIDAPDPNKNEQEFLRKSYAMTDLLALARRIETRHALFLFDSCFSGTVFKTRALPESPPLINRLTSMPVRQFITAGDADQTVPSKSVFAPAFHDAIKYGLADLNRDSYVTGTELGMFLQEVVTASSSGGQTPQYGKINDYELSRGDFVFSLSSSVANTSLGLDRTYKTDIGRKGAANATLIVNFQDSHGMDYEWVLEVDGQVVARQKLIQHASLFGSKDVSTVEVSVAPGRRSLLVRDSDDQLRRSELLEAGKVYQWDVKSTNLMGSLRSKRFKKNSD